MPYKTAAKDYRENIVNLLNGDINKIISIKKFTGTLLNFACKANNVSLAKMLLKKGADVNKGYEKETPLLLACKANNVSLAKMLLEKGAYVNEGYDGITPLLLACEANNLELAKMLLEKGAYVNEGYDEITPLLLACKSNNIQLAKMLLEKGAKVNYRLVEGNSYLHEACKNEYIEMVELLIEKGADLNKEDKRSGRVLLHELCAVDEFTEANLKILKLLIKKGSDVNCLTFCGKTPLFYASSSGCIQAVKMLVENGADINKTESNGETPLHRAVDNNSIEIVQLLTEKGADVNAIFLEDDENDDEEDTRIPVTPLNKAVNENYIEVAKHLILYVLLSKTEKPDYITSHESLSNFWNITLQEFNIFPIYFADMPTNCSINNFLFDEVDELAERFILTDLNRIIQKVEQARNKAHNREAVPGAVENTSYAFLIKSRLEKLRPVVEKIHKHYLNLSTRLRFISKSEEEVTLNLIFHREICSYLPVRDIKKLLGASLSPKSESTMTDPMIQNNAIDSLHSKPSSLEQEDNKHFRQNLEEQAKENTSRLEISKDSLESISHMMGSSGSSGLFANRKRKQDESSNETPEMKKLR